MYCCISNGQWEFIMILHSKDGVENRVERENRIFLFIRTWWWMIRLYWLPRVTEKRRLSISANDETWSIISSCCSNSTYGLQLTARYNVLHEPEHSTIKTFQTRLERIHNQIFSVYKSLIKPFLPNVWELQSSICQIWYFWNSPAASNRNS